MVMISNPIAGINAPMRNGFISSNDKGDEEIYCNLKGSEIARIKPRKTTTVAIREICFSFFKKYSFIASSLFTFEYRPLTTHDSRRLLSCSTRMSESRSKHTIHDSRLTFHDLRFTIHDTRLLLFMHQ